VYLSPVIFYRELTAARKNAETGHHLISALADTPARSTMEMTPAMVHYDYIRIE